MTEQDRDRVRVANEHTLQVCAALGVQVPNGKLVRPERVGMNVGTFAPPGTQTAAGMTTTPPSPLQQVQNAVELAEAAQTSCQKTAEERSTSLDRVKQEDQSLRARAASHGEKFAAEYAIDWLVESKTDEMSDSKVLTAISEQKAETENLEAQVKLTCSVKDHKLDVRALLLDHDGNGIKLLDISQTSRGTLVDVQVRLSSDPPVVKALAIGDFSNEVILSPNNAADDAMAAFVRVLAAADPKGQQATDALALPNMAEVLLHYSRLLFKIRTVNGDIVLRLTPYDPKILGIISACARY